MACQKIGHQMIPAMSGCRKKSPASRFTTLLPGGSQRRVALAPRAGQGFENPNIRSVAHQLVPDLFELLISGPSVQLGEKRNEPKREQGRKLERMAFRGVNDNHDDQQFDDGEGV